MRVSLARRTRNTVLFREIRESDVRFVQFSSWTESRKQHTEREKKVTNELKNAQAKSQEFSIMNTAKRVRSQEWHEISSVVSKCVFISC